VSVSPPTLQVDQQAERADPPYLVEALGTVRRALLAELDRCHAVDFRFHVGRRSIVVHRIRSIRVEPVEDGGD
jgi:hypothetical protein